MKAIIVSFVLVSLSAFSADDIAKGVQLIAGKWEYLPYTSGGETVQRKGSISFDGVSMTTENAESAVKTPTVYISYNVESKTMRFYHPSQSNSSGMFQHSARFSDDFKTVKIFEGESKLRFVLKKISDDPSAVAQFEKAKEQRNAERRKLEQKP